MSDRRAGQRRADLMHAEQLLLKIGDCLHEVDPERFQTEAAGRLN